MVPHASTCAMTRRSIDIALAGCAALAVAMGIGRFAFTPILPMMQGEGALDVAQGGWLASANYAGYLAGARVGAIAYNALHNWALGLVMLALGLLGGSDQVVVAATVLIAHVGMDRMAGYGLKYPTAFADTHLGRIGRIGRTGSV